MWGGGAEVVVLIEFTSIENGFKNECVIDFDYCPLVKDIDNWETANYRDW